MGSCQDGNRNRATYLGVKHGMMEAKNDGIIFPITYPRHPNISFGVLDTYFRCILEVRYLLNRCLDVRAIYEVIFRGDHPMK